VDQGPDHRRQDHGEKCRQAPSACTGQQRAGAKADHARGRPEACPALRTHVLQPAAVRSIQASHDFARSHQHWPWARAEGGSHHAADPADEANRDTLMQLPTSISIGLEKVMDAISGEIKAGTKVVSPDPKSAVPGHFWGQHQRARKRGPIIIPETAENPAKPALIPSARSSRGWDQRTSR
jgi:hypothetical protein